MYLQLKDLYTHLQPEIISSLTRETVLNYANRAAFPTTGTKRYYYLAINTQQYYTWDGSNFIETDYTDKVAKAISTGISEAISFLNRYNIEIMFSNEDSKRTFQNDMLDTKVKDLAVWHLLTLGNANTNLEVFRTRYEDALKWFEKVMKGMIDPPFPLKDNDPNTPNDDAGTIEMRSFSKRTNNY
jgi:phage gp36-like protein